MRKYAHQQTAALIRKLAQALRHASHEVDADAIHDVRVAMRRLSRCLRVFAPFYPDHYWKKIRHQLSALMAASGAVRDCDIAMELLLGAGVSARSAVIVSLKHERQKNGRHLSQEIERWKDQKLPHKWKERLEL